MCETDVGTLADLRLGSLLWWPPVTAAAAADAGAAKRCSALSRREIRAGHFYKCTREATATHPRSPSSFSTHQPIPPVRTGGLQVAKNSCSLVVLLPEGLQVTPSRQHGLAATAWTDWEWVPASASYLPGILVARGQAVKGKPAVCRQLGWPVHLGYTQLECSGCKMNGQKQVGLGDSSIPHATHTETCSRYWYSSWRVYFRGPLYSIK